MEIRRIQPLFVCVYCLESKRELEMGRWLLRCFFGCCNLQCKASLRDQASPICGFTKLIGKSQRWGLPQRKSHFLLSDCFLEFIDHFVFKLVEFDFVEYFSLAFGSLSMFDVVLFPQNSKPFKGSLESKEYWKTGSFGSSLVVLWLRCSGEGISHRDSGF